jgi:hypothetical protein
MSKIVHERRSRLETLYISAIIYIVYLQDFVNGALNRLPEKNILYHGTTRLGWSKCLIVHYRPYFTHFISLRYKKDLTLYVDNRSIILLHGVFTICPLRSVNFRKLSGVSCVLGTNLSKCQISKTSNRKNVYVIVIIPN